MPLSIYISPGPSIRRRARIQFTTMVTAVSRLYDQLCHRCQIPSSYVRVVLTDDFDAEVGRSQVRHRAYREPDFAPGQTGSTVLARSVPQTDDHSRVTVVFDSRLWNDEESLDAHSKLTQLYVVAHELVHPILFRARHASGISLETPFSSAVTREKARSLSQALADEYRADRLASMVIDQLAGSAIQSKSRKAGYRTTVVDARFSSLRDELNLAYPKWVDIVQTYRDRIIDLETMRGIVEPSVERVLTTLVHAQATADDAGEADLFGQPPLASFPTMVMHLKEPWQRFMDLLRTQAILPPMGSVRFCEEEVAEVGERSILEIWERLGLMSEKPVEQ